EIIKDGIEGNAYKKNKEKDFINYWGYKDGNYFVPKQSYAYGEDAGAELKSLIRQIHKKNMYIFMEFYFSKHVPTFMITDVLLYWKRNYGIDGFHVLGEEIPKKALISNPWLSESLLLFTDLSDSLVTDKADGEYIGEYIGEYNQGFLEKARRLLKGDYKSMECFLQKAYQGQDSFYQVNYLADQDGFTLNDCVSYNKKHNEENLEKNRDGKDENDTWNCGEEGESKKTSVKSLRFRQMKNAILMLAFSQGIPLLYAGDECGNSQKGNNNAYCQDNSIGWVNWDNKKQGKAFYNYVKKVIDFRKAHPILRKKGAFCRQDEKGVGYPEFSLHGDKAWMSGMQEDPLFLGIMYAGESQKKSVDDFIYIAYNFHWKNHSLALPKLPDKRKWHLVIDTKRANSFVEEVAMEEKEIFVEARTIKVLIGR
ncbi:MAG TPA: Type II secretory pathway, pullulanase PulA and related glycosidase, partial [Lachnospiraceae bacterium]